MRYVTHDGIRMRVGGSLWRWWHLNRLRLEGKAPAVTARQRAVKRALWTHAHGSAFSYTMDPERAAWLSYPVGRLPVDTDCSGHFTLCYAWAFGGALPDPNGFGYRALGYTGTLLSHAHTITTRIEKARPGDAIVLGGGTGDHVVFVVRAGKDPLVVSHGAPGVSLQRLSADSREPKRVCIFLP